MNAPACSWFKLVKSDKLRSNGSLVGMSSVTGSGVGVETGVQVETSVDAGATAGVSTGGVTDVLFRSFTFNVNDFSKDRPPEYFVCSRME